MANDFSSSENMANDFSSSENMANNSSSSKSTEKATNFSSILLREYDATSIAHFFYQNREDTSKIGAFLLQSEWMTFCSLLPEDDRAMDELTKRFYELCKETDELKRVGPQIKKNTPPADSEKTEAATNSPVIPFTDDPAGMPTPPATEAATPDAADTPKPMRNIHAILSVLDVFAIIAFVIISMTIKVHPAVRIFVFVGLLLHLFYSLYHITEQPTLKEEMENELQRNLEDSVRYGMTSPGSTGPGTGKDAHRTRAYMAPKEMQSWLRARTASSFEEAKLDAETEYRMLLRRLEDLKWDTFKKIEEAEERLYKYEGKQSRIPVTEKAEIQGRTCSNCGSNMTWNRESKMLICPFCGKSQTLTEKAGKPTLKDIDMAIEDGLYPKASAMVVELRKENKNDPQLILRSLRCSLHTPNISQALFEERKNPATLQKILNRSEWDLLSEHLPNRSKDFPRKAKKYCILSMRLLGVEPSSKTPADEEQSELTKPVAPSYTYDSTPAEIVIWILSALFVGWPCIFYIIWPVLKDDSGKILLAILFLFFTAIFVAIAALSLIAAFNWLTGAGLPDGGRTMKSLSKRPTEAEVQKSREMRRQQEEHRDQLFAELQELEKNI